MNRGYIRLWRKTLDADWIRNPKVFAFWCYCLLKVTHREYDAIVGRQVVRLYPGQFIFGLHKAAEETGLTVKEIRTILELLQRMGNLHRKRTNKYSVITIVNWSIYQSEGPEEGKQVGKQRASKGQAKGNIQEQRTKNKTYTADFETFWKAYPKKTGKDAAFTAWEKRRADLPEPADLLTILDSHKKQTAWRRDGGQYIPNPATWLNQGRWQDETEPEAVNTTQGRGVVPITCSGCGAVYLPSDLENGLCLNCRGARHEH